MNLRLSALLLALSLGTGTGLALAEEAVPAAGPGFTQEGEGQASAAQSPQAGRHMQQQKPESFTEDSTRTMADGRVFKRHVEQKVGDGSLVRKEVFTNPEGQTATRTVTASYDKDKKAWSRKIEGSNFDGTTWSRSVEGPGPKAGGKGGRPAQRPAKNRKGN